MSLWDFSLAFYKDATVQVACLQAQEEHGADVNVLLFLLWRARAGDAMEPATIASVDAVIAPWRHTVVEPLRALRRALKVTTLLPDPELQERFRTRIKALELEAERQVQALLEQQAVSCEHGVEPASAAMRNIAVYADYLGTTFPPTLLEIFLNRLD